MPWKVSDVVSERMRFVLRLLEGERMTDLCAEYEISRKTGYKLLERYRTQGVAGLFDCSRRPHQMPRQTSEEMRKLVLQARQGHPTWGPRKLRIWLGDKHPGIRVPSNTTIGVILARAGVVVSRKRRRRVTPYSQQLRPAERPNAVWCADYKGQSGWAMGNTAIRLRSAIVSAATCWPSKASKPSMAARRGPCSSSSSPTMACRMRFAPTMGLPSPPRGYSD